MRIKDCITCSSGLKSGMQPWHSWCQKCGYENADLHVAINETSAHAALDENVRAQALISLRLRNFKELLKQISLYRANGGKLLDVGCANGWFLDLASQRFDATGIEPDREVFSEAAKVGRSIRLGYFPEALTPNEKFDVIVFNDVFEHIPAEFERKFITNVQNSMKENAVLVIGCPSLESQVYASPLSKAGHVNCKSGDVLRDLFCEYFKSVFLFSMSDEVVHTGFTKMANYLFLVCVGKKMRDEMSI